MVSCLEYCSLLHHLRSNIIMWFFHASVTDLNTFTSASSLMYFFLSSDSSFFISESSFFIPDRMEFWNFCMSSAIRIRSSLFSLDNADPVLKSHLKKSKQCFVSNHRKLPLLTTTTSVRYVYASAMIFFFLLSYSLLLSLISYSLFHHVSSFITLYLSALWIEI